MGAHLRQLMSRGSSGEHVRPSRTDFKLYWFVRQSSGAWTVDFPGDYYYPGLTLGQTFGVSSKSSSSTVKGNAESAIWGTRALTGGNGGVSSTSLSISANGQRTILGMRITGTGIPDDTYVVSYPGGATGTMVISQAAAVANGTSLSIWHPQGITGIFADNGGVNSTTLTVSSGGASVIEGNNIFGNGIPYETKVVSYTGGASGTITLSQAAAVPSGQDCVMSRNYEYSQILVPDYEGGGEVAADMQNILTWCRTATGFGAGSMPLFRGSPPLGIYGDNQCAMNRNLYTPLSWTPDAMASHQASNDAMLAATTGTGDATCNCVCPEIYCYGRADVTVSIMRFLSQEWERMGMTAKLIPMINPRYPPGWTNAGRPVSAGHWRALLEAGIHDPNISGMFIWHADRVESWDANEGWFVETLDFIDTYGITVGAPF